MPPRLRAALEAHQRELGNLLSVIVTDAAPYVTGELSERLQDVWSSLEEVVTSARGDVQNGEEDKRAILGRPGLRDNFIAAQCAVLFAFVHRVTAAARRTDCPADVTEAVEDLWQDLSDLHEFFFGYGPPLIAKQLPIA